MTAWRFFVIIMIFCTVGVAWLILGGTIEYRTSDLKTTLSREVDSLWGPAELTQEPPFVTRAVQGHLTSDPVRSEIQVQFDHENRYKGLLWFSTYTVRFSGSYTVLSHKEGGERFVFRLPPNVPFLESLSVKLDGAQALADRATPDLAVELPPDEKEHIITVEYQTRGRDRWLYGPAPDAKTTVYLKGFCLTATTNFRDIDYPKGSVSPSKAAEPSDRGMKAAWKFDDYRTRQGIGIEMPARQNAGPIAARMAFYAPVSLFFFYTVMFTIIILKKVPLHPMHYLFISAGFFAFHILMAYLVDKIGIHEAFWICAAVSVFLVTSYMRLVAGARFAILYVGLAQLVYLIGFSYAFFWTGWTGLTVVIVAIITLFVLMQATGRIDWNEVFRKPPVLPAAPRPSAPAPPAPPAPPSGTPPAGKV